jgi:hypothetical protein
MVSRTSFGQSCFTKSVVRPDLQGRASALHTRLSRPAFAPGPVLAGSLFAGVDISDPPGERLRTQIAEPRRFHQTQHPVARKELPHR